LAISKERKLELVSQYQELFKGSNALIMTAYSGLSVKELEDLRRNIREVGGEFHIVKNRLADRALKATGVPIPEGTFEGPTAIGFAFEDVIGVAKAIVDLAQDSEVVFIKGAVIDGVIYDNAQVTQMAHLPPMPVVQAQLLSVIQAPASRVARVLAGSVRNLLNVFNAYSETEVTAA
jgi:large subunit ribosomal protein L10